MQLLLSARGIESELIDHDKYGFSRKIKFKVYDIDYYIIWFTNESTLHIGEGIRTARIPFKYMYLDTTYPLVYGNSSIGFSYTKNEKKSLCSREYPYEVFRIPIELNNLKQRK